MERLCKLLGGRPAFEWRIMKELNELFIGRELICKYRIQLKCTSCMTVVIVFISYSMFAAVYSMPHLFTCIYLLLCKCLLCTALNSFFIFYLYFILI